MSFPSRFALFLIVAAAGCAVDREREGLPSEGVHGAGILDKTSTEFHGVVLRDHDWDFELCQGCHGQDFGGGTSGKTCLTCHAEGPTACTTCHNQTSGSHVAHLGRAGVACAECHVVPARWDDEGHILVDGHRDDAPAEVVFGALANRDVTPPRRTGPAAYDPATGRCANVYCHGGTLRPDAMPPLWGSTAPCGSCHGVPPADHASSRCDSCHRGGTHIDAVIDVGRTCSSCHGDASSPAPPHGLGGEELATTMAVGAHRAHLDSHTLRGPVACTTCHRVPTAVGDAGHLDSAEPAEVVTALGWDRATATCTSSCHLSARPVWTDAGGAAAACGTCHGLPPASAPHTGAMTLASCTICHPSVDADGAIVFPTPDTSEHMDGHLDLR